MTYELFCSLYKIMLELYKKDNQITEFTVSFKIKEVPNDKKNNAFIDINLVK